MRHRKLDRARADPCGEGRRSTAQMHAGLRPSTHLDLLPREVHARTERLPDRFLRCEPAGVVLRRIRLRVTVGTLGFGEAPLFERVTVPLERAANALDLDQVDSNLHRL